MFTCFGETGDLDQIRVILCLRFSHNVKINIYCEVIPVFLKIVKLAYPKINQDLTDL